MPLRISLGYLRTFIDRHTGLVTKTAEERLAKILLRLSDQSGQFHPEGIEIRATNDELGALADISPFTASRVLNNWVQRRSCLQGARSCLSSCTRSAYGWLACWLALLVSIVG